MFPIEIRLKKRFYISGSEIDNNNAILEFFKKEFIIRKADNVRIENNAVIFNNIFFKFINNWNIMIPVDKGILIIKQNRKDEIVIEYLFSLKIVLVISGIIGIIIAFYSEIWINGLIAFIWLGGMNWLLAVIRHSLMFRSLNNEMKDRFL